MSTDRCGAPGCDKKALHLCSQCAEVSYCSKECQVAAWASHKQACKSAPKPEAASLMQSLKDLSVTQLRNVLKAKMQTYGESKRKQVQLQLDSALEKPTLLKLVQDHVQPSEVDTLLSKNGAAAGSSSSGSGSSSSGSGNGGRGGTSSSGGRHRSNKDAAGGGGGGGGMTRIPTPKELREKAAAIRKDPDLLRRMDRQRCGHLTDAEILAQVDAMEKVRPCDSSLCFSALVLPGAA